MSIFTRGNFVTVTPEAITTVTADRHGNRAKWLEKDLTDYDRIGLVAKVKDNGLICLSFGAEVYWFDQKDLILTM